MTILNDLYPNYQKKLHFNMCHYFAKKEIEKGISRIYSLVWNNKRKYIAIIKKTFRTSTVLPKVILKCTFFGQNSSFRNFIIQTKFFKQKSRCKSSITEMFISLLITFQLTFLLIMSIMLKADRN